MTIVSFSIDNPTLSNLNNLSQEDFKGKSEIIRSAINLLWSEHQTQSKLKGQIDALLLVKHNEKHSQSILKLRHEFQQLIQTHLHTHLENHSCLEILILKGQADKIVKFKNSLETSRKTDLVKLIVS